LAVWLAEEAESAVLVDYALGSAELYRRWGQGQCQKQVISGDRAWIDARKCIHCGTCETRCALTAIQDLVVDQMACQGCGVCAGLCAVGAISMRRDLNIGWEVCQKPRSILVKAPANQNADIATSLIKQQAVQSARQMKVDIIISSGPAVLDETLFTTLAGVALILVAVDPAKTKMPEFERVVSIGRQFRIPSVVSLAGEGSGSITQVEQFCREKEIEIVGRLSLKDKPVAEITRLWEKLKKMG
jgi:MinD superfamily P-loop ATPase